MTSDPVTSDPLPPQAEGSAARWEAQFTAQTLYLNTASLGLPPLVAQRAVADSLARWARGEAGSDDYDVSVERARARYAELVKVDPAWVAVGHQVSPLVGLIAAAVPAGTEVLCATQEFTSLTFPFAAHADRGVRVVEVPLDQLADRVGPQTSWVAVSAAQSVNGAEADLPAIEAACRARGAELIVDLTQAVGWREVDASRWAVSVAAGYKFLLAPRGTAFLTIRPDLAERLRPLAPGWYAGKATGDATYGLPLRLPPDARRFDISPAWHCWVGQAAALDVLLEAGPAEIERHVRAVSHAFSRAAGITRDGASAIVSLDAVGDQVPQILADHRAETAVRAGRTRVSFHLYNSIEKVEALGRDLRGQVR